MTIRDEVARAIGGGRGLYDYAGADAACAVFAAKLREALDAPSLVTVAPGPVWDLLASLQGDTTTLGTCARAALPHPDRGEPVPPGTAGTLEHARALIAWAAEQLSCGCDRFGCKRCQLAHFGDDSASFETKGRQP